MTFRSYDALRIFVAVAKHCSITSAASSLNLSKGSVSYQIRKLEQQLRFQLFERKNQRLIITHKGQKLLESTELALGQLDRDIRRLQSEAPKMITIGALTYFFSRWLSSRLMGFMEANPNIAVRVEPITGITNLARSDIDVAIYWGIAEQSGLTQKRLLHCPAKPTANSTIAAKVKKIGLKRALKEIPLLADSSGSTGWRQWHHHAGLKYRPMQNRLVIPDSNDRVQAVIDGQGIALWDCLIQDELDSGVLHHLSDLALNDAGYYLLYPQANTEPGQAIEKFSHWISKQD